MDLCIKASSVGDGEVKTSKLMTLPTILTLGRVVAVPFLVGSRLSFFFSHNFSFLGDFALLLIYLFQTSKTRFSLFSN